MYHFQPHSFSQQNDLSLLNHDDHSRTLILQLWKEVERPFPSKVIILQLHLNIDFEIKPHMKWHLSNQNDSVTLSESLSSPLSPLLSPCLCSLPCPSSISLILYLSLFSPLLSFFSPLWYKALENICNYNIKSFINVVYFFVYLILWLLKKPYSFLHLYFVLFWQIYSKVFDNFHAIHSFIKCFITLENWTQIGNLKADRNSYSSHLRLIVLCVNILN